jgi:type II secretory pathway component PulK
MNPRHANSGRPPAHPAGASGSVLIVVMWITFGIVAMALYFAHSMQMSLRVADNEVASMEADQAIEAAKDYYSNILSDIVQLNKQMNSQARFQPYMLPPTNYYKTAGFKIGSATVWCVGRDTNDSLFSHRSPEPSFGLVDEASKINLANLNNTNLYGISPDSTNTNLLQNLPRMTIPLLSCIYDWVTTNTVPSMSGAKTATYQALNTPYECKMTNFDTVLELRMVYGMTLDDLYGEDANGNGARDPNEDDGMNLPPNDNGDGKLDPGLLEYFTVYTQEPTNVGAPSGTATNRVAVSSISSVTNFLSTNFPNVLADISTTIGGARNCKSVLEFAIKSGISPDDLAQIEPYLMNSTNTNATIGLLNVNTATATALGCIPGIGNDGVLGLGSQNAETILQYRQNNPNQMNSVYWMIGALNSIGTTNITNACRQVGPFITANSWQYSADIVAVGHNGRGYRRVKFVYDCSSGIPLVVFREDLTYLGWALGKKIHDQLLAGNFN